MKKYIRRDKFLKSLIQDTNPLCFVTESGKSEIYRDVSDAYVSFIIRLRTLSPKCYLETPLCLKHLYPHISFSDCKIYAEELEKLGCDEVFLAKWDSEETRNHLEQMLRGICSLSGTNYSNDYFNKAWERFQNVEELMAID